MAAEIKAGWQGSGSRSRPDFRGGGRGDGFRRARPLWADRCPAQQCGALDPAQRAGDRDVCNVGLSALLCRTSIRRGRARRALAATSSEVRSVWMLESLPPPTLTSGTGAFLQVIITTTTTGSMHRAQLRTYLHSAYSPSIE